MESADDIELPLSTSPPVHVRKLKRLKKAAVNHRPSHLHDDESPNPPSSLVRLLYPEPQSSEDSGGLRLEEPRDESSLELELPAPDNLHGESEFVGSESARFGGDDKEFGSKTDESRAKRVLEFDSAEERLDAQRGGGDGEAIGEGMEDSRSDLPEKRQSGTEVAHGGVEDMKKRKKRKAKGGENCVVEDENQAHATNKRRSEKVLSLDSFAMEHNSIPL